MTERNLYGVSPEVLGPQSAQSLKRLTCTLERIFSVRLDSTNLQGSVTVKNGKEFCVGLLENPVNHVWGKAISRLPVKQQISVAGSLFLARKIIPVPTNKNQERDHFRSMSIRAADPPPEYWSHLVDSVTRMFPIGWDKKYSSEVFRYTPSDSSCLEYGRSEGGLRTYLASKGEDWYQDQCLGAGPGAIPFPVKYQIVRTSGKDRGVTISSGLSSLLAPLHRCMYNFISGEEWLLRGDARGRKFKAFKAVKGEVFVSGDYESATDNLNTDVAEFILRLILGRSRYVPEGIKEFAISSLRAQIQYSGGIVCHQEKGQLMGNFLSFPLLCLQNYFAFRFLLPRNVPVKINGDDIVFRCLPHEFDAWAEGVSRCGLTLSRGKTMVHRRVFSLNSSFFIASGNRVGEVPVIRMTPSDGRVPSGGDFLRFIRNWRGMARTLVGALWLRHRAPSIKATGRSVSALGIPADNSQLHWSGLAGREAFFRGSRGSPPMPEIPVPILRRGVHLDLMDSWTKMPKSDIHSGRQKKEMAR